VSFLTKERCHFASGLYDIQHNHKTNGVNKKLVLIEWLDSHAVYGWHTEEPSEEPLRCRSVGWLIYDGERAKTIAAHITDEEIP
jgi:hypothetical protein